MEYYFKCTIYNVLKIEKKINYIEIISINLKVYFVSTN